MQHRGISRLLAIQLFRIPGTILCGVYSVLEAASRVCLSTCSYCKGKRAMHHTMLGIWHHYTVAEPYVCCFFCFSIRLFIAAGLSTKFCGDVIHTCIIIEKFD